MHGRRTAFTLLEVLVALVVTGLVVALAYAALQGGLDTRERLARHRSERESAVALREMIRDALRHAIPGVAGGPAVFTLVDRLGGGGGAADSLEFLTRGIVEPFGTSGAWRASVSVDGDGLHFSARPEVGSAAPVVVASAVGVRDLDVRALGRGAAAEWVGAWTDAGVAPQAVMLAMAGPAGPAPPLVTRLGLERQP